MPLTRQAPADFSLRRLRRLSDLTQVEVARRLGVSQAAVAQWETGKTRPSPERFVQLRTAIVQALPAGIAAVLSDLETVGKEGPPRQRREMTAAWKAQLAEARQKLKSPEVREKMRVAQRAIQRERDATTGRYAKK